MRTIRRVINRLILIVVFAGVFLLAGAGVVWAQEPCGLDVFGACGREAVRQSGAVDIAQIEADAAAVVAKAQAEADAIMAAAQTQQYTTQAQAQTAIAAAQAQATQIVGVAQAEAQRMVGLAQADAQRLVGLAANEARVLAEREATARLGILAGVNERNAQTWSMAGVVVAVVLALAWILRPAQRVSQNQPTQLPAPPPLVQLAARRVTEETGLVAWCAPGRDGKWKVYTSAGAVPVRELRRLTVGEQQ